MYNNFLHTDEAYHAKWIVYSRETISQIIGEFCLQFFCREMSLIWIPKTSNIYRTWCLKLLLQQYIPTHKHIAPHESWQMEQLGNYPGQGSESWDFNRWWWIFFINFWSDSSFICLNSGWSICTWLNIVRNHVLFLF